MNIYFKSEKNQNLRIFRGECNFYELIFLAIFLVFFFNYLDFNQILGVFMSNFIVKLT